MISQEEEIARKTLFSHKPYLEDMYLRAEQDLLKGSIVSCCIAGVCERGFRAKMGGLWVYIPYALMPWKYTKFETWKIVGQHMIGSEWLGNIESISYVKSLIAVQVHGNSQIEKPRLIIQQKYRGVVLAKTEMYLLLDIGMHFKWEFGKMLVSLQRRSLLGTNVYNAAESGGILELRYWGLGAQNEPLFTDHTPEQWAMKQARYGWKGREITAKATRLDGKKPILTYDGKHRIILAKVKGWYGDSWKEFLAACKRISLNDQVRCRVMSIARNGEHIQAMWLGFESTQQPSLPPSNTIADRIHNAEEILNLIPDKSDENDHD